MIDVFLAWQYVVGSLLFLAGGLFNYWRVDVVVREEIAKMRATPPTVSGKKTSGLPNPKSRQPPESREFL